MSIYVDALTSCLKNKNWRYDKSCHLFADTLPELLKLAGQIGLYCDWIQIERDDFVHFDLNPSKRRQAVMPVRLKLVGPLLLNS